MFNMRTLLAALLCGALAACGAGGSSPPDNSNSVGGQDGSGGNPDSPTGGGGGDGVQCDPKSDGTCQPITGTGGDDGNGGSSGAGGAAGGCADDERILDSQDNLVCPGTGGMGGQPDAGVGGIEPPPGSDCPDSIDDMAPRSPCLLDGNWISTNSEASLQIQVTSQDETFRIQVDGVDAPFTGTLTATTLPAENSGEYQGDVYKDVLDIDNDGNLITNSYRNEELIGSAKFRRN